jgi:hypothetical protein
VRNVRFSSTSTGSALSFHAARKAVQSTPGAVYFAGRVPARVERLGHVMLNDTELHAFARASGDEARTLGTDSSVLLRTQYAYYRMMQLL